ncbi:hypothetical protein F8388_001694 [Cannabis sativa]|uniref:Uncharacterized protein n=1 Tax=Cannabis sativa TaxID=3483 RepID=A0A7J6HJ67_CANSA|nr:hypothetical protein F8388_001694 [Cannabis sativa]
MVDQVESLNFDYHSEVGDDDISNVDEDTRPYILTKLTICDGHDGTAFSNGDLTKVRSTYDDDDQCKRQQRGPTIVGSEDVPFFLLLPA